MPNRKKRRIEDESPPKRNTSKGSLIFEGILPGKTLSESTDDLFGLFHEEDVEYVKKDELDVMFRNLDRTEERERNESAGSFDMDFSIFEKEEVIADIPIKKKPTIFDNISEEIFQLSDDGDRNDIYDVPIHSDSSDEEVIDLLFGIPQTKVSPKKSVSPQNKNLQKGTLDFRRLSVPESPKKDKGVFDASKFSFGNKAVSSPGKSADESVEPMESDDIESFASTQESYNDSISSYNSQNISSYHKSQEAISSDDTIRGKLRKFSVTPTKKWNNKGTPIAFKPIAKPTQNNLDYATNGLARKLILAKKHNEGESFGLLLHLIDLRSFNNYPLYTVLCMDDGGETVDILLKSEDLLRPMRGEIELQISEFSPHRCISSSHFQIIQNNETTDIASNQILSNNKLSIYSNPEKGTQNNTVYYHLNYQHRKKEIDTPKKSNESFSATILYSKSAPRKFLNFDIFSSHPTKTLMQLNHKKTENTFLYVKDLIDNYYSIEIPLHILSYWEDLIQHHSTGLKFNFSKLIITKRKWLKMTDPNYDHYRNLFRIESSNNYISVILAKATKRSAYLT